MDKIHGNYLTQSNRDFPMDCETLNYIMENATMCEMLGNIAGDKVILWGCELNTQSRQRSEGYVFLRTLDFPEGEVLRFEGGNNDNGIYLKKQDVAVTADGYQYPKAYTRRSLASGMGTENFSWNDFVQVQTNRALYTALTELQATVQALVGEPLGIVKMWAGGSVPSGYHLCDGSPLKQSDYPALYAAIGNTFNAAKDADGNAYTTQAGYFRLPDLSGRFVVGYRATDADYNQYGKAGGEKKHLLTAAESGLPAHTHEFTNYPPIRNGNPPIISNAGEWAFPGSSAETLQNEAQNATSSHENRPPYYVLAYIMKLQ